MNPSLTQNFHENLSIRQLLLNKVNRNMTWPSFSSPSLFLGVGKDFILFLKIETRFEISVDL